MDIIWSTEAEFLRAYEIAYPNTRQQDRENLLYEQIMFTATLDELKAAIPLAPQSDNTSLDSPGPVEVWWGQRGNIFFYLTFHIYQHAVVLSTHRHRADECYLWSILNRFNDLPRVLLRRIVWIKGHQHTASKSIFFTDKFGIRQEVYRAETRDEAQALLDTLSALKTEMSYTIGESEPQDKAWVVIKQTAGAADQIVARYGDKATCERVAQTFSTKDDAMYRTVSECEERLIGLTFKNGLIMN